MNDIVNRFHLHRWFDLWNQTMGTKSNVPRHSLL